MSFTINTNAIALPAQNNLNQSQQQLNTAIQRLSSGSKINSAKDNAAGQAIANRMSAQINGLNQASSNANDGISLAQTTEGALDQINDNLQHIRTLAEQAANGTNSQSDLNSIQDEIQQRMDEIDRTSQQTAFNGTKVLDGSKSSISIQVGAQDGQTIKIDLQNVDSKTLLGKNGFNINGYQGSLSSVSTSTAIQGVTVNSGASASSTNVKSVIFHNSKGSTFTGTLEKDTAGNYFVESTSSATSGDIYAVDSFTVGSSGSGSSATATLTANVDTGTKLSKKSPNPLSTLDKALNTVDSVRSGLGAVQNRFQSAINDINSTSNNLSSARSRITDTDYATEVSNLSKAKILQQAGTSVLAQANQTNQGVLSLLQNA
jgi:flagellin